MHGASLPRDPADWPAFIRRCLARGVADPKSAFHWPSLATVTAEGAPAVRTVVLRHLDPDTMQLAFTTDRRSSKVRDIAANPAAAVHVHDPRKRVQLRLGGTLTLATDGPLFDALWARAQRGSLLDFSRQPAPGVPIADPDDAQPGGVDPAETFAVLLFDIQWADYLDLSAEGHLRARVDFRLEPAAASWLVP